MILFVQEQDVKYCNAETGKQYHKTLYCNDCDVKLLRLMNFVVVGFSEENGARLPYLW